MRVKVKKHSNFRASYDYDEVVEAESVRKEIQGNRCWLRVDDCAFEMPESEVDKLIEIGFNEGKLDLTNCEITSVPW